MITQQQREDIVLAAVNCEHQIDADCIRLWRDPTQEGSALSQLVGRIESKVRQYIQQSLQAAPVQAEPINDPNDRRSDLGMPLSANAPLKCPITRRPFFMVIEHPELGWVPTYGGPYDSYTIPHMEGKPDEPFHERELTCCHFDHDAGHWSDDETIPMRVINEQVLNDLLSAAPQPQQEQP